MRVWLGGRSGTGSTATWRPARAGDAAADLRRLRESDNMLLRASSEHIFRWTVARVLESWPAYCEASREIRAKMKAAIAAEQRVLYPILAGLAEPNFEVRSS